MKHQLTSVSLNFDDIIDTKPQHVCPLDNGVVALLWREGHQGLVPEHPRGLEVGEHVVPRQHHPVEVGHTSTRIEDTITLLIVDKTINDNDNDDHLLWSPAKQLSDVAKEMMFNGNEGRSNLKCVNVGVESIWQPGSSQTVFICSVIQLVVEIRMTSLHWVLYYRITEIRKLLSHQSLLLNFLPDCFQLLVT